MLRIIGLSFLLAAAPAAAIDVALIGVIGDKAAVLAIDGGDPKTVKVGQKWQGVTVLTVQKDRATVEIEGKPRVLMHGQHYRSAAASAPGRPTVMLAADPRGHFVTNVTMNGSPVRAMVDTGATMITLPAADAQRLGIDYRKGERGFSKTAGGLVPVFRVRLDTVKVGDIAVNGVECLVIEQGLDIALLGMSFLNRVEMKREGPVMTLIQRF